MTNLSEVDPWRPRTGSGVHVNIAYFTETCTPGYFKTARLLFAHGGNCASKQTDTTLKSTAWIYILWTDNFGLIFMLFQTFVGSVVICSKKGSYPVICMKYPTETTKLKTERQRPLVQITAKLWNRFWSISQRNSQRKSADHTLNPNPKSVANPFPSKLGIFTK